MRFLRLVFMGTPAFALPSLQALYDAGHELVGVFTQPDRPAGRGKKITASPVKLLAEQLKLPIFQPDRLKAPANVKIIKELAPECIIVVAYGQILSKEILDIPRYGCVNVHASLLPAYRGAAPIHWAVINGETKTGVTTMLMDEGLDTGDMLLTAEYAISSTATTGEVHDALAELGAQTLLKTLNGLEQGTIKPKKQPQESTYAPLLKREDERLDWSWSAWTIHNRIRGLNPWPGAFTTFRGEQVKIWRSKMIEDESVLNSSTGVRPGQILASSPNGLLVMTGDGKLEITELQPAGKKRMSASDFFNGRRVKIGDCLV